MEYLVRNSLIGLMLSITLSFPLTSYGESNAEIHLSETIKKIKESKPENIELNQIFIENGLVRIEGSASEATSILNYFDSIEESKIGKLQDNKILSNKKEGREISNFFAYIEPPSIEELHPFVSIKRTEQSAWWFGAEFHPFGKTIRGIPIGSINTKWCKANEFERELFPKSILRDDRRGYFDELGEILKDGRSFSVTGKFDGLHQLTAIVGVYETCKETTGTFLLLLDIGKRNAPVVFLQEFEKQFFAYLKHGKRNGFVLLDCYGCDGGTAYQWDKSTNRLVWKNLGE